MTRAELLALALKVLGVYFAIETLMFIPGFIIDLNQAYIFKTIPSHILYIIGQVVAFLFAFAIAYVLIGYGNRIAKALISDDEEIAYSYNPAHLEPILKIAVMIIAVWCLARGVPQLAGHLIDLGYRNYQGVLDVVGW
ncbi:MAG: hypothetical protein A2Y62_22015 [Candidatus Fischerbacteria bacterium RBG_13_37_8]|uniref:Uncharacterized protein n=1 Tax=Candidatus Fischerbacteria bacterium RBG_13_37_8 TaxID=1817863 RepID=A0A1F5VXC6_9BACT|nr:MAG: hypothetical protein A2Y62_22015 [Candidatus Fischerbacteria bacterium RBG_13_37_8]